MTPAPAPALRVWNPARDALLAELVKGGSARRSCVVPLNELPGAPITRWQQVAWRMHVLGLRLSPEHSRAAHRDTPGLKKKRGAQECMTPERAAYMREAYPAGVAEVEIWTTLSAMAGPPLKNPKTVRAHAQKLGLRRLPRVWTAEEAEQRLARQRLVKARSNRRRRAHRSGARPPKPPKLVAPPKPAKEDKPAAELRRQERAAHRADMERLCRVREAEAAAAAPPEPIIEPSPAIADAVTARKYDGARMDLSRRRADPAEVARKHGLPLREVFRLQMVLRMEARA
ncbi:hypothetical protein [Roseococcus pinisoli]|uniref:ROS/MUCR transcriptional regulator protein n=1 Tax=Roseococcus pinisoli TaxID=2835040 RepID=A0ABS5QBW2_9PROT|nr:hypothetical protein [Roseococcus pinisoli]MBS7811176.1 hypothetical protein [Roseococcus pinisoli]